MTIPVGGLRARLLKDSLYNMINDAMAAIGWFDTGRQHMSVTFRTSPVDDNEEIVFNTIALTDGDIDDIDIELGSLLAEHRWTFYVDCYAENNSLGLQISHDVKAILEGRMPSVGRDNPSFSIYDYRTATPTQFGVAEIENVMVDRAQNFPQPFKRYWYSVALSVIDTYGSEDDNATVSDDSIDGNDFSEVLDGNP